jgi:hypothetical protein
MSKEYQVEKWHSGSPERLKPGMVIVARWGNRPISTFLVGHVNQQGGSCNCCDLVHKKTPVKWGWLKGLKEEPCQNQK